jgi:hypothetical protein
LPFGGLRVQERGELALWEHDALGELLVRQADHVQHGGVDLGWRTGEHLAEVGCRRAGGQRVAVEAGQVEAARERLEPRVPGTDVPPSVAPHDARHHVPHAGRLEHQADLGLGR